MLTFEDKIDLCSKEFIENLIAHRTLLNDKETKERKLENCHRELIRLIDIIKRVSCGYNYDNQSYILAITLMTYIVVYKTLVT